MAGRLQTKFQTKYAPGGCLHCVGFELRLLSQPAKGFAVVLPGPRLLMLPSEHCHTPPSTLLPNQAQGE